MNDKDLIKHLLTPLVNFANSAPKNQTQEQTKDTKETKVTEKETTKTEKTTTRKRKAPTTATDEKQKKNNKKTKKTKISFIWRLYLKLDKMADEKGTQKPAAPQNFDQPQVFVSEAVKGLHDNPTFLEDSIQYAFYKQIFPVERIDSSRPIKSVQFRFK